jgi:hypothetical protein
MPLPLLVLVVAIGVIAGQVHQASQSVRALSGPEQESAIVAKDMARYLSAYQGWLAANPANPSPTPAQLFPAYGFTPRTYQAGRSTLYAPASGSGGNMVVCYVPQYVSATRLQAQIGTLATVGLTTDCPAPAASAAGAPAQSVFYTVVPLTTNNHACTHRTNPHSWDHHDVIRCN